MENDTFSRILITVPGIEFPYSPGMTMFFLEFLGRNLSKLGIIKFLENMRDISGKGTRFFGIVDTV